MKCSSCSRKVKPVIALDIDGTLGDFYRHFINFLTLYLGVSDESWMLYDGSTEFSDWLGLDKKTYREAKLAFRTGGFKRWMPAFQGLNDVLFAIGDCDVELWITTTRPWMRLDNLDPDTREWLSRNDVQYDGLLFNEEKYLVLTETIDADRVVFVVDDELAHLDIAASIGLPTIQRKTNWNIATIGDHVEVADLPTLAQVIYSRVRKWKLGYG